MQNTRLERITVRIEVPAPREAVWQFWTQPEHIIGWNFASDDWHTPRAENDVRIGGIFNIRMEAKDGSAGFDNIGTYTNVVPLERLEYEGGDRHIEVLFQAQDNHTIITQTFDPDTVYPLELQRQGWQAILDNFKKYVIQQISKK